MDHAPRRSQGRNLEHGRLHVVTMDRKVLIAGGVMTDKRVVPGYEDYRVCPDGSIWSMKRGQSLRLKWIYSEQKRYPYVFLYKDGKGKKSYVFHVVLWAFGPKRKPGEECRHLDGNPENNHISNLAWGSAWENSQDKWRHGTMPTGAMVGRSKLTKEHVLEIRRRRGTVSDRVLAREFGVSHTQIRKVATGESWLHFDEGLEKSDGR